MKKFFLLTLSLILSAQFALADSPLTSTPFSNAYKTNKYVMLANESGYFKKTEKALGSKKVSSLDKLLMVNAIGWKNKSVGSFEAYLVSKRKGVSTKVFDYLKTVSDDVPAENDETKLLSADDLMCWAYFQALSDYNKPALAIRAAFLAYKRDPANMSYGVVLGLVAAQKAFDRDWCDVYQTANQMVVGTEYSNNQLNAEAVKIIMDYIGLYKQDCKE
jgi:hypothetical protein